MQKKLLSVCCLGYNHAKFIEANINAILSSKYENIEIIAVDDGSTDNSQTVLKQIAGNNRYPVNLILQENTGSPAKNFNRAIEKAAGEFITFISFDDVLNMPVVDNFLMTMNEKTNLGFITSTNFDIIDAEGKFIENRKLPVYQRTDSAAAQMLDFEYSCFESFWLQGTVFRKEIIDAVHGFDEDMLADDIVLRTKVLRFVQDHKEYSFVLSEQKSFFYRLHGKNISGNTLRQVKSVAQYLNRYWPDRENPKIFNEWLSYTNKVYDISNLKSLWIQDKRFYNALNDESVIDSFIEKIWPAVNALHKERLTARLYFDIGAGVSEENCIKMCYSSKTNTVLEFKIPETVSAIKTLRFDPAEESGVLWLKHITLLKKSGAVIEPDLNDVEANCSLKVGEKFIYKTVDPVIVLSKCDFSELSAVKFEFSWPCNEVISDELIIMSQLLKRKKDEINSLYNSRSWKLSKPVRIVGSILRKILNKKLKNALRIFKKSGLKGLLAAIRNDRAKKHINVRRTRAWSKRKDFILNPLAFGMEKDTFQLQSRTVFSKNIKFSILVPLYNTPKDFLQEMIGSCLFQTYANWELCLADGSDSEHSYVQEICEDIAKKDIRIKYKKLVKNGGISANTNECIKMATGDYISLFDHDDLLHPAALFETMKAICEKDADFVYTDEATFKSPNLNEITFVNFKPDFAPDYFCSLNYICHFTSFKRSLLDKAGNFNSDCDGAQDFDLFLRLTEIALHVVHVPKCLYYWRASSSSTASSAGAKNYTTIAGQKALESHFKRLGLDAEVLKLAIPNAYRIKYPIRGNPLVSILIPSYEHVQTLKKCIDSIRNKSTYKNYEIIIIENNSKEKQTFDYYDSLKADERIKIVTWKGKFNYSAINNFGFKYAKGDYILLLNNDIEVITPEWIEEMLMFAQRDDVGAVGAMLYYPSDKIQHGGVILGISSVAGHSHKYFPRASYGYASRLITVQNFSCVTAACLMISSEIYREINGLDESFEVAFNDVDFCMRLRKMGYLNVWTPFAELYHYESESRGYEDTPEKQERFVGEIERFKSRWKEELSAGDPYYNPNLTLDREDFSVTGDVFPNG